MTDSERVSMILAALEYTPKTLAAATGMSEYKAKKILTASKTIKCGEAAALSKLTGIRMTDLFIKI